MYTRCSHCHTVCEVSPETLARGRGRLPCAGCGQEFDALLNLTSDAPKATATPAAASPQGTLDLMPPEPAPERTDVLVDVLAAHADFIEPFHAGEDADASQPAAPDEAESGIHTRPSPHHARAVGESAQAEHGNLTSPESEDTGSRISLTRFRDDDGGDGDVSETSDAPRDQSLSPQPVIPTEAGTHLDLDLSDNSTMDPSLRWGAGENIRTHETAPDGEAQDANESATTSGNPDNIAADTANPFHPVINPRTPSFIPDTTPTLPVEVSTERTGLRWLAVAALLLLLIGQSIYAERDLLAAEARWRPSLERACGILGCTLAAWHDPVAMRLMTRDVRPHPSVPDALLISASFRNDAPWAQHWPRLHLTLSDLNGQTIAQREFAPDQYLGMTARDLTIQPDQTASVTLEVRDPGKQAVAFEFDFR